MTFAGKTSVEYSREINEPLYGSIKPYDVYFLLEYNGIYGSHVWDDSTIPQAIKDKLNAYPKSKPLLIRQPADVAALDRQITCFIIRANAEKPVIYRLDLESYEALLSVDIDAVLAGEVVPIWDEPVYAVCCNGRRDVCCSTHGVPVYNALSAFVGDAVWQVSHFGGHRYAGTMLAFPHAYSFGRLDGNDAIEIVRAYESGIVSLSYLRGRAIYPQAAQAAEYFLRVALQNKQIKSLTFVSLQTTHAGHEVRFDVDTTPYFVRIIEGEPLMVLSSTGNDGLKPVPNWKLGTIHKVD